MTPLIITLFLTQGNQNGLRTSEISDWVGKLAAVIRSEIRALADHCGNILGVYILIGHDDNQDSQVDYIGESESLGKRLMQHDRSRKNWDEAVVLFSKDNNLTKSHIRYLEGRLIEKTTAANRKILSNYAFAFQGLPESDEAAMETFFEYIEQLLQLIGCNLLIPLTDNYVRQHQKPPKGFS